MTVPFRSKSVVNRIKDFFGIHSPSTLFAGLGKNMGEGISVGFEDAMFAVSLDMQNAIPTRFDVSTGGVSGQSGAVSGTTITQNISVVTSKALSEKELSREFRNLSLKLALEF